MGVFSRRRISTQPDTKEKEESRKGGKTTWGNLTELKKVSANTSCRGKEREIERFSNRKFCFEKPPDARI